MTELTKKRTKILKAVRTSMSACLWPQPHPMSVCLWRAKGGNLARQCQFWWKGFPGFSPSPSTATMRHARHQNNIIIGTQTQTAQKSPVQTAQHKRANIRRTKAGGGTNVNLYLCVFAHYFGFKRF